MFKTYDLHLSDIELELVSELLFIELERADNEVEQDYRDLVAGVVAKIEDMRQ